MFHIIMPYRCHEVEEQAHVFHGADEPGDELHIVRASVTWREVQRTSLQGAGSWEGEQIHWRDRIGIQKDLGC